jgi:hypothetical protein
MSWIFLEDLLCIENEEIIDVIIADDGIGKLVNALCFNRSGIKVLHEFGLENEIGVRTRKVCFYSFDRQFLFQDARGLDGDYHWPQYIEEIFSKF